MAERSISPRKITFSNLTYNTYSVQRGGGSRGNWEIPQSQLQAIPGVGEGTQEVKIANCTMNCFNIRPEDFALMHARQAPANTLPFDKSNVLELEDGSGEDWEGTEDGSEELPEPEMLEFEEKPKKPGLMARLKNAFQAFRSDHKM